MSLRAALTGNVKKGGAMKRLFVAVLTVLAIAVGGTVVSERRQQQALDQLLAGLEVVDPLALFPSKVPREVLHNTIERAQARGWQRTSRVARSQVGKRPTPGIVLAQDGLLESAGGEMIIWDWDDNNADTMEGTVYMEWYATGEAVLMDIQFDITDPDDIFAAWEGEATWTTNDESDQGWIGSMSDRTTRNRPSVIPAAWRMDDICCVSSTAINTLQLQCFNSLTSRSVKDSWAATAIGAGIGGVVGALKWGPGGPTVSLGGAIVGAAQGAGSSAVGNFILNVINISRDGGWDACKSEAVARKWCQENCPTCTSTRFGYTGSPWQCLVVWGG
jgi:hypothetical protein